MTHQCHELRAARFTRRSTLVTLGAMLAVGCMRSGAIAQERHARQALQAMSDYLVNTRSVVAIFDSTIEVVTPALQKIQFASSGKLILERPSNLRVERTGGYADATFTYDGKILSVFEKDRNIYAQAAISGTIDDMLDTLRKDLSIEPPGADLLHSNVYESLTASAVDGRQIGRGVIAGVECDHFAFRGDEVDWQIWIEVGAAPVPRKYVVTSKAVAGAPEYSLVIRDWRKDPVASDAFSFVPPEGAKKVAFAEMSEVDEVPPARTTGEK